MTSKTLAVFRNKKGSYDQAGSKTEELTKEKCTILGTLMKELILSIAIVIVVFISLNKEQQVVIKLAF